MTIAVEAMLEACWPDDIPRTYEELRKMYGPYIAATIRRHNKIGRNFDEQYSYVWQKLIEKDVIKLFMMSVEEKAPKHLTAPQACAYLGISFKQFKTKMWSYHIGVPIRSKHVPGRIIGRKIRGWMPTPINSDDLREKSRMRYAKQNAKLAAEGKPLRETNGSQSIEAKYDVEDIAQLMSLEEQLNNGGVLGPFRKQGPIENPLKPTKSHFQAYLSRSIYSDWANWCRTYKRKWSQDRPMFLRTDDEHDESNWESNLVDPGGTRQETRAMLKECMGILSETLYRSMRDMPSDGLKCKPVAQTEIKMYGLLEQGVPLQEALKKCDIPEKIRRNILKSISDIRVRAA